MFYIFAVFFVFAIIIGILITAVIMGQRIGIARLERHPDHKLEVDNAVVSAVFGLLALLIAFSFSGAYERLEKRKMHVLEEAKVFNSAFNYIDLVDAKYQRELKELVKQYFDAHIAVYRDIPDLKLVAQHMARAAEVEVNLLAATIKACKDNPNKTLCSMLVPGIDNMFRTSQVGINMSKVHPPAIIFVLLISLAASGAFLIGYNSAENKQKLHPHMVSYVLLVAFTIYIIINIEYPRIGFINLGYFDKILVDARNDMENWRAYDQIYN